MLVHDGVDADNGVCDHRMLRSDIERGVVWSNMCEWVLWAGDRESDVL